MEVAHGKEHVEATLLWDTKTINQRSLTKATSVL